MSDITHPLLSRYFRAYCKFFSIDIETALIEGRSFDIIDLFRINLGLLLDENVLVEKAQESLKSLIEVIDEEANTFNSIKVFDCTQIQWFLVLSSFNKCKDYFIAFIEAYEFVFSALELNPKDRKIQDLLVEFNNALSHILSSFYSISQVESNLNKAKTHLYRGILDSYKEVIHKNSEILRANNKKHSQLDDKTFLDFYIELRKNEALNIGANNNDRQTMIKQYKLLSWNLIN